LSGSALDEKLVGGVVEERVDGLERCDFVSTERA
jgi:hypothetical protein